MKRLILLFLAALALLCACSAPNAEYGYISAACEQHSLRGSFTARFRLNMTFEEGTRTLLFSQGSYEYALGEESPRVSVKASQNYLGEPSALDAEYKDGIYSATGEKMTGEEFFGQLLFVQPFVPEEKYIASAKEVTTGAGRGVTFVLKDATGLLFPLLGESIYSAALLNKPRTELTKIGPASLTLIPAEGGGIASMTLNFTLTLADTPPYVPGGADMQDEYTLVLAVEYTVSFE